LLASFVHPRVADVAPGPDNSSRARLAAATGECEAAQKDLTNQSQPKSRLEEIISRAVALESELATCQAADERALPIAEQQYMAAVQRVRVAGAEAEASDEQV
jgi:hypothetical protein